MRHLIPALMLVAGLATAPVAFAATTTPAAKTAPAKAATTAKAMPAKATPAQPSKKSLCAKAWSKETNRKGGRKAYMKACLAKG